MHGGRVPSDDGEGRVTVPYAELASAAALRSRAHLQCKAAILRLAIASKHPHSKCARDPEPSGGAVSRYLHLLTPTKVTTHTQLARQPS